MKRPIDAVTADTLRLLIPVDIPEPWAEQGSVLAWRARHADFLAAVGAAGEGVKDGD